MAVKLDFLQPNAFSRNLADNEYLYKDLYLDLQMNYSNQPGLLAQANFNDARAIYDTESVFQSLNNIFNTLPGQKFLNPGFGLDLRSFLFNRATVRMGYVLGLELTRRIPQLEPRVNITSVNVTVFPDDLTYQVDIYFTIPSLVRVPTKTFNISVKFNANGFTIV
jgi:phage baseplate assembly protein W